MILYTRRDTRPERGNGSDYPLPPPRLFSPSDSFLQEQSRVVVAGEGDARE